MTSTEHTDVNGLCQYTVWKNANSDMPTTRGTISYQRWCRLEAERISKSHTATVYTKGKFCALWGEPISAKSGR